MMVEVKIRITENVKSHTEGNVNVLINSNY